jgi:quercetin dioxygenase-like cupin family protein
MLLKIGLVRPSMVEERGKEMPGTKTTEPSIIHVLPGVGEPVGMLGEGLRVVLSTAVTDPPLLLLDIVSPPGGGPPALHTHPQMESFYIFEGNYEFSSPGPDGPVAFLAGPGSVIYVPGGAPHNYNNVGETTGHMLGIFTSAAMEDFFREMSAATTDDAGQPISPPDMAKLMEIMGTYDVAFVDGVAGS